MNSEGLLKNCAICCEGVLISEEDNIPFGSSILETQLNAIFILKNIFEVKADQLGSFLGKWGDPGKWVNLCEKCDKDVASIRRIFEELYEITRKFQRAKCGLQEKIRVSEEIKNGRLSVHEVIQESRSSYCQKNASSFTPIPIPMFNPLSDGDLRATEMAMAAQLQNHVKKEEVINPVQDTSVAEEDLFQEWNMASACDYHADMSGEDIKDVDGHGDGDDCNENDGDHSNCEFADAYAYDPPRKRSRNPIREKMRKPRMSATQTNLNNREEMKEVRMRQQHPCPEEGCSRMFKNDASVRAHVYKNHKNSSISGRKSWMMKKPKAPPKPKPSIGVPSSSFLPTFEVDMSKFTYTPENPAGFCNICGKHMDKFKRFKDHMRAVHYGAEVCTVCGEASKNLKVLRLHLEQVHSIGDYKCEEPQCNMVFLTEPRLLKHKTLMHSNGEIQIPPSECEICQKKFTSRAKLNKHVAFVHERKYERICPICFSRMVTINRFKMHMTQVHDLANFVIPPPLNQLSPEEREELNLKAASISGSSEKKKMLLRKKSVCHLCGNEFETVRGLKRHVHLSHENDKEWECDVEGCSRIYLTKVALETHQKSRHPMEKPKCVCQYCGKEFGDKKGVRKHELKVHKCGSRCIKCPQDQCNQAFTARKYLMRHLKFTHKVDLDLYVNVNDDQGNLEIQSEVTRMSPV